MSALLHALRRALGALKSRPGYIIVTTVTLALGIGATTAIFSVVDALMLRPLPFAIPLASSNSQAVDRTYPRIFLFRTPGARCSSSSTCSKRSKPTRFPIAC